jgi:endoglycosylceramidase
VKWLVVTVSLAVGCAPADASTAAPAPHDLPVDAGVEQQDGSAPPPSPDAAAPEPDGHSLAFEESREARSLHIAARRFGRTNDLTFFDGLGREASFRGFNVSGSAKLVESGFKPFRTTEDARASLARMRAAAGSNIVRFTISWEGVQPAPATLDMAYLDAIVAQLREAIAREMYVVIDYHSDLYSRHTFTADSAHTGNGAPGWVVLGAGHGVDDCGVPCLFTWSAHKLSDSAVRSAMRAFWLNASVTTPVGELAVQDEFLAQLEQTARYLGEQLTPEELDFVLGIEPINEPFDGGLQELGIADYPAFDNDVLWPFHRRVRSRLDAAGWADKWVFAEPLVFWNSIAGVFAPATGGGHLDEKPGAGFVFAPHFYDQARQGVADTSVVRNAAYFPNLDQIRDEARSLGLPVVVGEFGMGLDGSGHTDPQRVVNGTYQALETSDVMHGKDRFADLYTPLVSGIQWQWDHYHDQHGEYLNGNLAKFLSVDDAWNGENYSVVSDRSRAFNVDPALVQRVFPRRIQGGLLHFAYAAGVRDSASAPLVWSALRVAGAEGSADEEFFRDTKFALAVWQGRLSEAPTELFVPPHFDLNRLLVITERGVWNESLTPLDEPQDALDEVLLTFDRASEGTSHRLLVWDDLTDDEQSDGLHFVLLAESPTGMTSPALDSLRQRIVQRLAAGRSPVYLTTEMTHADYPQDL